MADRSEVRKEELTNSPLLEGVEIESIMGLLSACPVQELAHDETLIEAGKPNECLYLLLSGNLRIHLKPNMDALTILGPGEVVGELSVIDGQAASAWVIVHGGARLLAVDEVTLWSLVESSHHVARNLLLILSRRLRHGNVMVLTSQQLQHEYERYAVVDALTGLYNRRWLDKAIADRLEELRRDDRAFSIMILDLDGLKTYNDTYGHLAGDRVLYTVGAVLKEQLGEEGQGARYGGDEFVAILPGIEVERAQELGEKVLAGVKAARIESLDDSELPSITTSVGVAQARAEDSADSLIAMADTALYSAKKQGGNLSLVAEPS